MAVYTEKQGNSFWFDYELKIKPATKTIADIDSVWANWNATWKITNGTITLAGNLTRSVTPRFFYARIDSSVSGWDTLPPGDYTLTVETKNLGVNFCFEDDDDTLTITAQKIS
jgi:hypothetical protein